MKTPEELQALREEYAILTEKLKTLTEEELKLVTGGAPAVAGKEIEIPIGEILRGGVALAGPRLNSIPVSEVDAIKEKLTGTPLDPSLVIEPMCTTKPEAFHVPDPSDRQEL